MRESQTGTPFVFGQGPGQGPDPGQGKLRARAQGALLSDPFHNRLCVYMQLPYFFMRDREKHYERTLRTQESIIEQHYVFL